MTKFLSKSGMFIYSLIFCALGYFHAATGTVPRGELKVMDGFRVPPIEDMHLLYRSSFYGQGATPNRIQSGFWRSPRFF